MKKISKHILGLFGAFFFGATSLAMDFSARALPQGALRRDLDRIFKDNNNISNLTSQRTWKDLNSWHWHVGRFTDSSGYAWIIKGCKYPAGVPIVSQEGITVVHGASQNLSRMVLADEVDQIIQAHKLDDLRTVNRWVYPLSGNDADLANAGLSDQDVLIIEEQVIPAAGPMVTEMQPPAQKSVVFPSCDKYEQLCVLAEKGHIMDLHRGNVIENAQGEWVLIDLEDLLTAEKEEIERSHFFVRPINRYKLRCKQEASAKIMVAMTAMQGQQLRDFYPDDVNTSDDQINQQRALSLLLNGLGCLYIKSKAIEMGSIIAAIPIVRNLRHIYKTNQKIQQIILKQRKIQLGAINDTELTDEKCFNISQIIVSDELPNEKRQAIIKAFATILRAQSLTDTKGSIVIFSKKYASCDAAIKEAQSYISRVLYADNILSLRLFNRIKTIFSSSKAGEQNYAAA
ncbi:MAG TPA: hypothetical protein VI521_02515 [Candidatus Babeliales bacterium]|nr:hypothetical protein [Candidatus Babeliales bacterium]